MKFARHTLIIIFIIYPYYVILLFKIRKGNFNVKIIAFSMTSDFIIFTLKFPILRLL